MADDTVKKATSEQKAYACEYCESSFSSKKRRTQHTKTVHFGSKAIVCQFCGKSYKAKSSLDGHILASHVDEVFSTSIVSYFKCKHCEARFISQSKLKQHQTKNSRDSEKDLRCDFCPATLSSTCAKRKHLASHAGQIENAKPFACILCGKRFLRKSDCNKHEKIHDASSNDSYPCGYCKKTFAYKYRVELHMKAKHKEKYLKTFTPGQKAASESDRAHRSLSCDTCGKKFQTAVRLQEHLAIHTGKKQNLCEYCGCLFAKRSNLRAHLFIHTGGKPHQCEHCSLAFISPVELTKHEKRHLQETQYKDTEGHFGHDHFGEEATPDKKGPSPREHQTLPGGHFSFGQSADRTVVTSFYPVWQDSTDLKFSAFATQKALEPPFAASQKHELSSIPPRETV